MTLEPMIGKKVLAADRRCLGRLHGFKGKRTGPDLHITHITVGLLGWLENLWPHPALRRFLTRSDPLEIPWEAIESVDRHIQLKPSWHPPHHRRSVRSSS